MKRRQTNIQRNAHIDREYQNALNTEPQTDDGGNDRSQFVVNIGTCPKSGKKGAGKKATISLRTSDGAETVLATFTGNHGKDISKKLRRFVYGSRTVIPPTAPIKSYGETFFLVFP